jgi:hypothetical protein
MGFPAPPVALSFPANDGVGPADGTLTNMATFDRLRCACCGLLRRPEAFGIDEEGTFIPDRAPAHDMVVMRAHLRGRAKIDYERLPLPLNVARGLRQSIAAALDRLDEEIATAEFGTD